MRRLAVRVCARGPICASSCCGVGYALKLGSGWIRGDRAHETVAEHIVVIHGGAEHGGNIGRHHVEPPLANDVLGDVQAVTASAKTAPRLFMRAS